MTAGFKTLSPVSFSSELTLFGSSLSQNRNHAKRESEESEECTQHMDVPSPVSVWTCSPQLDWHNVSRKSSPSHRETLGSKKSVFFLKSEWMLRTVEPLRRQVWNFKKFQAEVFQILLQFTNQSGVTKVRWHCWNLPLKAKTSANEIGAGGQKDLASHWFSGGSYQVDI